MATGRRDYTWGFQNESVSEGRNCISIAETGGAVCLAGSVKLLLTYTVPIGYRLGINRITINTPSQATNYMYVVAGTTSIGTLYFSVAGEVTYSDQNPYYLAAGNLCKVNVYNDDDIDQSFSCCVIGVLEKIS